MPIRIELHKTLFDEKEKSLCQFGEFRVTAFRFDSGVHAIRLKNSRGEIVLLPFQGMQVWRARFDGRELTMRSMFEQPNDTQVYLETYGAFLIHCGLAGLGAPGPDDTHPLHGELPNAPMDSAWLSIDNDSNRITVTGEYQYTVAFSTNYKATISTAMTADSALLDVDVAIENLKQTSMDMMYLAHANFCPVDNGELLYSANYSAQHVRVRQSIPAHVTPKPGYKEFLDELAKDPTIHHVLKPDLAFDPEVVFEIDLKADEEGYGHALQIHPQKYADYIRYQADKAPVCMRWICRTPDQDGLGVAFPSTSGVEGYTVEKAKGRAVNLAGGETWQITMQMGHLTESETKDVIRTIEQIQSTNT